MWLFDDILKKPTPAPSTDPLTSSGWTSGSWQPPSDDTTPVAPMPKFVIEKSEETTIFWPETEDARIEIENATPKEPEHYAENDENSILVGATPVVTQAAAPVVTQNVEQSPLSTAPVVPLIEEQPIVESPLMSDSLMPSLWETASVTPIVTTESTDDFFSNLTGTPSVVAEGVKEEVVAPGVENISLWSIESSFSSPKEFIERSLESIDTMIGKIDMKHTAKIEEAEWYGREKVRFTDLEKNAYVEADGMDKEKAHTLRMRKLLEKELILEDAAEESLSTHAKDGTSRGGSLSKVRKANKKDRDEVDTLVGL